MKRIATELGSSTMALYYYVRTKADIIALMHDTILEDVLIPPDETPADWREATAEISRRSRNAHGLAGDGPAMDVDNLSAQFEAGLNALLDGLSHSTSIT